jgi:broad specificity phosphatase PhoE
VVTSPARRCRAEGAPVDPRLGPWDLGTWAGRPWDVLDLASWRADPAYDGHGGESLLALRDRVAGLFVDWHGRTGRLVAITHAAVIKAAVTVALRAPADAAWDVDVAPGSGTEFHATPGGWRLVRLNAGWREPPREPAVP